MPEPLCVSVVSPRPLLRAAYAALLAAECAATIAANPDAADVEVAVILHALHLRELPPPRKPRLLVCPGQALAYSAVVASGARGFLGPGATTEELRRAVRDLRAGAWYLDRGFAEQDHPIPSDLDLEILSLLAAGFTEKAIASQFHVSQKTVGNHLRTLRDIYGADSLAQLVAITACLGLCGLARDGDRDRRRGRPGSGGR